MSHRSRAETDGYKNPPQNIPAAAIKCKLSLMIEDIVAKKWYNAIILKKRFQLLLMKYSFDATYQSYVAWTYALFH